MFSFLAKSLDYLVSFDCLFLTVGFFNGQSNNQFSTFYLKLIAYGIAPIVLSLASAGLLGIRWYRKSESKRKEFNFKKKLIVSTFIMIYVLYPTIVNLTLSLFNCIKLEGTGISYLNRDFTIKCWTP